MVLLLCFTASCKDTENKPKDGTNSKPSDPSVDQPNPIELTDAYWWPQLQAAKKIVECKPPSGHEEEALALSLAGLMAKGVNNGVCDELVWIDVPSFSYSKYHDRLINRLGAESVGEYDVWGLLEYCRGKIDIPGYVVYKKIENPDWDAWNESMDQSFNVACMYAGVGNALLVEEKLEQRIKDFGFKRLKDARNISMEKCFNELRSKLNNNFIITMHPGFTNLRDFGVAYNGAVTFGTGRLAIQMMGETKPVSPVLGWNTGGESDFIIPPTQYGLFNTATNWCYNFGYFIVELDKCTFAESQDS